MRDIEKISNDKPKSLGPILFLKTNKIIELIRKVILLIYPIVKRSLPINQIDKSIEYFDDRKRCPQCTSSIGKRISGPNIHRETVWSLIPIPGSNEIHRKMTLDRFSFHTWYRCPSCGKLWDVVDIKSTSKDEKPADG